MCNEVNVETVEDAEFSFRASPVPSSNLQRGQCGEEPELPMD